MSQQLWHLSKRLYTTRYTLKKQGSPLLVLINLKLLQ